MGDKMTKLEKPKKIHCPDVVCKRCPAFRYDDCGAVKDLISQAIEKYDAWLISRLEEILSKIPPRDNTDKDVMGLLNNWKESIKAIEDLIVELREGDDNG